MRRWPAGGRGTVYVCLLVLGFCAFVLMIYGLKIWAAAKAPRPEFGDFLALWSYGTMAATHPAADVYDPDTLHGLQVALGMQDDLHDRFPYPPVALLLFRPLASLPYRAAYVVWTAGTLLLFVGAVAAFCSRRAVCLVGAVVAPVTVSCVAAGQTGLLTAALLTAGVRLAGPRPVCGGVLIGLLAYKPQMAALVPIAFAAAGYWRAFLAAGVTVVLLAAAATAIGGAAIWAEWLAMLPGYLHAFDGDTARIGLKPTVLASVQQLGLPLPAAQAVQGVVAVIVAALVWRCFRQGAGRLAAAALLVGAALATPHAFTYDLPCVVAGIALLIDERLVFGLGEIAVLVLAFTFPIAMMLGWVGAAPVGTASMLMLFGVFVRGPMAARSNTTGN